MPDKSLTQIDMRVSPVFATLIAEFDHPDASTVNSQLEVLIQGIQDSDLQENRATTIVQGWRTKSDLLDYDEPVIKALREFFDQCLQSYVKYSASTGNTGNAPRQFSHRYKGWAVILEKGGFQQQHVHSRTDVVGVYCVNRPSPTVEFPDVGGALTLVDPCTGRLSTQASWESPLIKLQPEPGRLFLLPSYVAHQVEPLTAPGKRITINFDSIILSR